MPEEGIELSPNRDILTTAEIHYLSALFVNQGVNKIRLTGGEPTVRKDIIPLMRQIGNLRSNGLKELALTTNGISLHRKLDDMVEAGLTGVNISLDTLDPFQFQLLTRRQGFSAVMKSIDRVKEMNKLGAKIKLKINCVVMRGLNDHQILPFVDMTQDQDVEVRFIEYMPFGGNKWNKNKMMSYEDMLDAIRVKYPDIGRLRDARNDTSKTWQVPGHESHPTATSKCACTVKQKSAFVTCCAKITAVTPWTRKPSKQSANSSSTAEAMAASASTAKKAG
jgi:cyclic pyranopterin phosphate synthase